MPFIQEINNTSRKSPKILVAPLDWGLGHATRCIPIIKELIEKNCEVIIAAEGPQKALLKEEFPAIRFINVQGYGLKYGRNKWATWFRIIFQIPKILIRIKRENRWLERFLLEEELDGVISDNRYGLYSASIFSVFITHQLHIITYFGKGIDQVLQKINYRKICRFSSCWVPDFEEAGSLAGTMAHPKKGPEIPIRYLGPLTRFKKINTGMAGPLVFLLSGPEPQRTIFEKKILAELQNYSGKAILIRGLPGETSLPEVRINTRVCNHLPSKELNKVITESDYVIGRCGYSSIMDLAMLGKKTILIPTPGQPEQEYLANYLFNKRIIFTTTQDSFSLESCLQSARQFSFLPVEDSGPLLFNRTINEFLLTIQTRVI